MDKLVVVKPHPLNNTGAICHFNSLLQSLLCCNYLVNYFLEKKDDEISKIIHDGIINSEGSPDHNLSIKVMRLIAAGNPAFAFGQQSACEGFSMFVDKLKLEWYFEHKHKHLVTCSDCNITREVDSGSDVHIHVEVNEDLYPGGVPDDISHTLRDKIFRHKFTVDKYKCSNKICEVSNCPGKHKDVINPAGKEIRLSTDDKCVSPACGSNNVEHIKSLCLLPEYLVIYLPKYSGKRLIRYPQTMVFPDKQQEPLYYHTIAQIEHYGTLGGGHYISYGKRGDKVYQFNDGLVSEFPNLEPTPNTYIVFYELRKN